MIKDLIPFITGAGFGMMILIIIQNISRPHLNGHPKYPPIGVWQPTVDNTNPIPPGQEQCSHKKTIQFGNDRNPSGIEYCKDGKEII